MAVTWPLWVGIAVAVVVGTMIVLGEIGNKQRKQRKKYE